MNPLALFSCLLLVLVNFSCESPSPPKDQDRDESEIDSPPADLDEEADRLEAPSDVPEPSECEVLPPIEGVVLFEDHFSHIRLRDNWTHDDGFGVTPEGDDEEFVLRGEGFVPNEEGELGPASISSRKYFLTDHLRLQFRFKHERGEFELVFSHQPGVGEYRVLLTSDELILSREESGDSSEVGRVGLERSSEAWREMVVRNDHGHIEIAVDGDNLVTYDDEAPVPPGQLVFHTLLESSLFLVDDLIAWDTDPDITLEHGIEIDAAVEGGELDRVYRCTTLWTLDTEECGERASCPLTFDVEGPTAGRLRDLDFTIMRVRAIGDDGWLGGGVLVTKTEDGSLEIDFSYLDKTVSEIRSMGKEVYMRLGYEMPRDLASEECTAFCEQHPSECNLEEPSHTEWPHTTCPPEDYTDWEELVYQLVKHYNVDLDYHIERWVVWNEPDIDYGGSLEYGLRNVDNYLRLYEASVKGALRADPTIKIGGPTVAESCGNGPLFGESCFWMPGEDVLPGRVFTERLLQYCAEKDLRLDMLVFHRYSFYHPKFHLTLIGDMRSLAGEYGLSPELVFDEWSYWDNGKEERIAAYAAASIHYQIEAGLDLSCYTSFNGLQDENEEAHTYLYGMGLAMIDGQVIRTPYFVFLMLGRLADTRLSVSIDGGGDITADDSVGVIATRDDSTMQILLWRYDDAETTDKCVHFGVSNLGEIVGGTRSARVTGYLIDATHNNTLFDFDQNRDGVANLTTAQLHETFTTVQTVHDERIELSVGLSGYSVLLLIIEPSEL